MGALASKLRVIDVQGLPQVYPPRYSSGEFPGEGGRLLQSSSSRLLVDLAKGQGTPWSVYGPFSPSAISKFSLSQSVARLLAVVIQEVPMVVLHCAKISTKV